MNFKNLIKLMVTFSIFYFSKLFRYIPIYLFSINLKTCSDTIRILLSIFSSLCTFIIFLFIYRNDIYNDFEKYKKNKLNNFDISFKYYLVGLLMMIVSNVTLSLLFNSTSRNEEIVQSMINTSPLLMFINACLLAPFIEEMVFRKGFKDCFTNKYLFIILSSLSFGLLHVVSADSLGTFLFFIPYSLLGSSLAYMDYKSDSVIPSIIFHTLHNSFLVLISIL
jgi:membrane protease YdiL (CAAX protease family)